MDQSKIDQLTEQYQDYFSVEHQISLNVRQLGEESTLPDQQQFEATIPPPFLLSSEVSQLNLSALRSLNRLGELAQDLANYLQKQAQKMDMLLHYVLQQQDNAAERFLTQSYGGSGCCYLSQHAMTPLQIVELKLFLANNDGAIFCYAQVLSCEAQGELWRISLVFVRIRDEDRELIVRASLHQQSQQLKAKALQRLQQQ